MSRHMHRQSTAQQMGFTLPTVLSIIIAMSILMSAVTMVIMNNFFVVGQNVERQQAFNIAEAGINYYLWHMAHNPTDYQDGKGLPAVPDAKLGYGPYQHTYYDTDAKKQGTYTLWIQPQSSGSTVFQVRSIGKTNSGTVRTIEARLGAASFASYGLLSDVEFWFGNNETADGPVFSNQGIHMDGPNTDTVGAANATYKPLSQYGGDGSYKNGVWCSSSVTSPVNCATRDKSTWQYPQPSVDFNQVVSALCTAKKVAFANDSSTAGYATQSTACNQTPTNRTAAYVPRYSSSFSNRRGYYIQLNSNSTYDLYKVSSEDDTKTDYASALTMTLMQSAIPLPSSGVIFVEDNVWVRTATKFSGRITIAAGRLGADTNNADINIVGNLLYNAKTGSDAIGLVAENDILVAPYAPPSTGAFTYEIDAATLAQSGSVTYPSSYKVSSSRCTRGWTASNQKLVYYGSVATRQYWTWNYQLGSACGDAVYDSTTGYRISGIKNTTTSYDYNLYYAPPPSYPVTGSYEILNWREVLTRP